MDGQFFLNNIFLHLAHSMRPADAQRSSWYPTSKPTKLEQPILGPVSPRPLSSPALKSRLQKSYTLLHTDQHSLVVLSIRP